MFVTIHEDAQCRLGGSQFQVSTQLLLGHLEQQRMVVVLRDPNVRASRASKCASIVVSAMLPLELAFPLAWISDLNDEMECVHLDTSHVVVGVVGPASKFERCNWTVLPASEPVGCVTYTDLLLLTVRDDKGICELELYVIVSRGLALVADVMGADHLAVATFGLLEPSFSDAVRATRLAMRLSENPRQGVLLVSQPRKLSGCGVRPR